MANNNNSSIQRLLDIMTRLRDPNGGCPWDLKQDFNSILPHTLEEAYEVADAIESGDRRQLQDELGDLLFQVVFYSQLGKEEGSFQFHDIVDGMTDKLIRRHPHVFGDLHANNSEEALDNWETIKTSERQAKAQTSAMDDIPRAMPSLQRAEKIQKRARNLGFDWPDIVGVIDKLDEEVAEFKQAHINHDVDHMLEEIGDLMFVCVNLVRHLKANPEQIMRAANNKFESRFRRMETNLQTQDQTFDQQTNETLELAWQQAKREMVNTL